LFDVELTGKGPGGNSKYSPITEVRSIVAPVRRSWLAIAASVLLVFGAGFGSSFFLNDQRAAATPVVIGAAPTLPAGACKEVGGFAWVPPQGWRRDVTTGAEVHYTSPEGNQELVAKVSLARGDLMETWRASEQGASGAQSYRRISFLRATFRGWPAVVWEYAFTLSGLHWHALLLGFNAYGKSYQINTWYQPQTGVQALKIYSVVKDSFTVL
jgi:hypothetical protein